MLAGCGGIDPEKPSFTPASIDAIPVEINLRFEAMTNKLVFKGDIQAISPISPENAKFIWKLDAATQKWENLKTDFTKPSFTFIFSDLSFVDRTTNFTLSFADSNPISLSLPKVPGLSLSPSGWSKNADFVFAWSVAERFQAIDALSENLTLHVFQDLPGPLNEFEMSKSLVAGEKSGRWILSREKLSSLESERGLKLRLCHTVTLESLSMISSRTTINATPRTSACSSLFSAPFKP